jgi:serine-type D-Ala-D-Ala carboxypeptidase/endopeptidase (penicillin-binding protein 4)
MMRSVALLAMVSLGAARADLRSQIEAVLGATPAVRNAFWGIHAVDTATGNVLYQANPHRYFVPASNVKLFSTALALARLGPDHRYRTRVIGEAPPDSAGRLAGPLVLVGGGDPNLSGRTIPYRKDSKRGNPLAVIEDLADQVVGAGVRRVNGDVIGDDTAYVWAPYPEGWAAEDPVWEYGAPVSALTVSDNALTLTIVPGAREGEPARISTSPAVEFYQLDNRIRTTAKPNGRVYVDRQPGSLQVRLWGSLPLKGAARSAVLGIEDPALYAAMAFRAALVRRGVAVSGRAAARHRYANDVPDLRSGTKEAQPQGVLLAQRISPPLSDTIAVINKVSQNLHAELLLREVGLQRRGIGTREAGLAELEAFLTESGVSETEYELVDGSGLSRLNLVSPAAVTKLLLTMYRSPARELWFQSLPVGGEDGTLSDRFPKGPAARRIRAKTGTLAHVSALSGYAQRRDGGTTAFSILANNYHGKASEIRAAIDRISSLLVE